MEYTMPVADLLELTKTGGYEALESRVLELLDAGQLALVHLVGPCACLEAANKADRLATLVQMVFESVPPASDPASALALVRAALIAAPQNETWRKLAVELYRSIYGQAPGFDVVLEASGLQGGRPVRNALKLLNLCLEMKPGDTLISCMDDRVVEVADIDRERGLFTLRREGRTTTRPAPEVVREYDRIESDDFRVLRQLRPERLVELIENDPVAVVAGLIHAHGGLIDADVLKQELVPKHVAAKDWSRWWTRARGLLKRCPNVVIEGRSPVILTYSAAGRTLEDETWATLEVQKDPADWMATVETYLREKASRQEQPDEGFLRRFQDHVRRLISAAQARRPVDALAAALVLDRLAEKGMGVSVEVAELAHNMLRDADDPGLLLRGLMDERLRERGLAVLATARPDEWAPLAISWLPTASAGLLDRLTTGAIEAGATDAVQSFVDRALGDPARYPELLFWLWKGPRSASQLRLPTDDELFRNLLDTLSALGRTLIVEPDIAKEFRLRIKSALALRNYDKVRGCLQRASEAAAITIRRQLERLEGLGDNARYQMLDLLRDAHPEMWYARPRQIAPWEDRETIWCTDAGMSRRAGERDEILNVKMPENAKRIGEAASHGDLSENSEYKFALEERDLLRARLATINDELSRARSLTVHDVPSDYVGIGSRVTLRRIEDGVEQVMTYFGPFETDVDRGLFSYMAPVAQKLMGHHVGDRIVLTFDGRDQEFEIAALANAMEQTLP
jgi:transcription elongation factor GreA